MLSRFALRMRSHLLGERDRIQASFEILAS